MIDMDNYIILTRDEVRQLVAEHEAAVVQAVAEAIEEATAEAYNQGYDDGYSEGESEGYANGAADGYDEGFEDGEFGGYNDGYNVGRHELEDLIQNISPTSTPFMESQQASYDSQYIGSKDSTIS